MMAADEGGVFLKAFVVVFCRFKDESILILMVWRFWLICFAFLGVDFGVLVDTFILECQWRENSAIGLTCESGETTMEPESRLWCMPLKLLSLH